MNELRKIVLFLVGTTLLGALLAPWLFWGGRWLAAQGIVPFLAEPDFPQYFDRAVLVAAVALLWPTIRSLRITSRVELGIHPDPRWWQNLTVGFLAGCICMAAFGLLLLKLGVYKMKGEPPWGQLAKIAVSAFTVGMLEEWLFRGAFFGLFRRAMSQWPALVCVSTIYSILHFVKPPGMDLPPEQVDWLTGLRVLPSCFVKFSDPALLAAGFTTLFLLGWMLGCAVLRTRALWLGIGLHAGLVFAKMGFSKLTKRKIKDTMPWIGEDMIVGLGAITVLLLAWAVIATWLQYGNRPARTPDR